jgi:hypothetical protein
MGRAGLEHPQNSKQETLNPPTGGSKSGNIPPERPVSGPTTPPPGSPLATLPEAPTAAASSAARPQVPGPSDPIDPDLAAVVAAWSLLPSVVRAGIAAMVRASGH